MSDTWTIAQAAVIIQKPSKLLQRTVERAPVKPALAPRGGKHVYVFDMRDLVFFCAFDDMKNGLTSHKQSELYNALKNVPIRAAIGSVSIGSLRYDFGPFARIVKKNIEATAKLASFIDEAGDEPIIKGTDISVYRVAALHDGMTVEEILKDYPTLRKQQVHAAKAYAESHPKAGRPYPKNTAKRTMRESRADVDEFLPTRE